MFLGENLDILENLEKTEIPEKTEKEKRREENYDEEGTVWAVHGLFSGGDA